MTKVEFKVYRDKRIRDLGSAYDASPDKNSDDPQVKAAWERLRSNWQDHSETVKQYAYEDDTAALMETWRAIVQENRYRNEHEGIALNPGLTGEQIAEILTTATANEAMYWVVHHLVQHPNKD